MAFQGFKGGKMYVSSAELEAIHTFLGDNPAFGGFWRKVAGMQGATVSAPDRDAAVNKLYGAKTRRVGAEIPEDIALIQIAMAQGLEISEDEESRLNEWMAASFAIVGVSNDNDTLSVDDI